MDNDDMILINRSNHQFDFMPARIFRDTAEMGALILRLQDSGLPERRKIT